MGGENRERTARLRRIGGSSPHGRGKPQVGDLSAARLRLIPAWAGKTTPTLARTLKCGAHPRMGGENPGVSAPGRAASGSSPHGRGKREDRLAALALGRLIPAWAGKTGFGCHGDGPFRAHPRMGGENRTTPRLVRPVAGSSPHGRGKLAADAITPTCARLIPAWAGKTSILRP